MTELVDLIARAMCFKMKELVPQRLEGKDSFQDEYEALAHVAIETIAEFIGRQAK